MESKYHEGAWSLVFVTSFGMKKPIAMVEHPRKSQIFALLPRLKISVAEVETTLILEKRCKEEEASALDVAALVWPRVTSCSSTWCKRQAKLAEERLKAEALTLQLAVCYLSSTTRLLQWLDDG